MMPCVTKFHAEGPDSRERLVPIAKRVREPKLEARSVNGHRIGLRGLIEIYEVFVSDWTAGELSNAPVYL